MPDRADELIGRADLDGLLSLAVDLLHDGRWGDAQELRNRCLAAVESGRQLWPVAAHIAYRAVLQGPIDFAVEILETDAGTFALGPYPEVASGRADALEVQSRLAPGSTSSALAHELAARGRRTVSELDGLDTDRGVPLDLALWEPTYLTPEYKAFEVLDPPPKFERIPFSAETLPDSDHVDDELNAFDGVFEHWITRSEGRVEVAAASGDVPGAVRALGPSRAGIEPISSSDALRWLHWAGGCGGAWGRRRGGGTARFELWWSLATLTGLDDHWPLDPAELGAAVQELQFHRWDAGEPAVGWTVRLAVHDPVDDLSWAIAATDAR
ncbi:MAG: hypothetical protein ACR2P0_04745 [Acidimicrobiales bacterium]